MRECAVRLRGVSPGDGCTFREQRQTALSCASGTVLAVQLDTARSLGVVLSLDDNQRYSRLGVLGESERRVFLEVSRTVTHFDCPEVQTGLFLFWFLPFYLFCLWRVAELVGVAC